MSLRLAGAIVTAILISGMHRPALAQQSRPTPIPGRTFQSPDSQRLESDDAQSPAYLWIEEGKRLWSQADGSAVKSCESCHGAADSALKGIAAHYPKFDAAAGGLLNIEGRINRCRTAYQQAPALAYESNELLALTTLVSHQSYGVPRQVDIGGTSAAYFEAGRKLWTTRQGQFNLACTQCHDASVGKTLRGDKVSQGQSDGWPAYRLDWQKVGSLHRRLRACSLGVRAQVLDFGSPEYLALELYLAWRGEGLPLSSPGVRR